VVYAVSELTNDNKLQTTNYKLQTTNYKLQTTNYTLQHLQNNKHDVLRMQCRNVMMTTYYKLHNT